MLGINIGINQRFVSSDSFSPADVADLTLWLDASDSATITESGGLVSQWDDKSGNTNHATQATGSLQPTTGTRTLNGLNVIDYIPTDYMDLPAAIRAVGGGNNTTFLVAATDNTGLDRSFIDVSGGTGIYRVVFSNATSRVLRFRNGGSFVDLSGTLSTDAQIVTAQRNGIDLSLYANGGTGVTASGGSDVTGATTARLGDTFGTDGYYAEVLIYTRALTTDEINQVGNYLGSKWGLTWTDIS